MGTFIEELTKGDASTESINLALKQFRANCRQELGEEHWALSFAKGLANCAFILTASFLYVVGCIFIGALCGVLLAVTFPFPPLIALGVGGGALLGAVFGLDTVSDFAEEIKSRPTLSPIKEELEPIFSYGMLNDSL